MPQDDEEGEIAYFTREQALAAARDQATRDLVESDTLISFVAFVPGFEDYGRCEFRFEPPHGWTQTCRMLSTAERAPDEQITDDRIRAVGRSGNLISALRLYRGLHGVGLAEAKRAVERLIG